MYAILRHIVDSAVLLFLAPPVSPLGTAATPTSDSETPSLELIVNMSGKNLIDPLQSSASDLKARSQEQLESEIVTNTSMLPLQSPELSSLSLKFEDLRETCSSTVHCMVNTVSRMKRSKSANYFESKVTDEMCLLGLCNAARKKLSSFQQSSSPVSLENVKIKRVCEQMRGYCC